MFWKWPIKLVCEKMKKSNFFSLSEYFFSNFFFLKYFSVDKLTNAKNNFWLAIFGR